MSKKKNNTNQYYNPNLAQGYAIIDRNADFQRMGTAIHLHNLDVAHKIDMEALKDRAKYADELEWEKKKSQDAKQLREKIENPSWTHVNDRFGENPLTDVAFTAHSQMMQHLGQRDIPGMPKDYGLTDFYKDTWNSFFSDMNKAQADNARGYQVRATADEALINTYLKGLDELDEIDRINTELYQLSQTDKSKLNKQELDQFSSKLNQLNNRKNQLLQSYQSKAADMKRLEDLTSQSSIGAAYDDLMAGNGIYGSLAMESINGKDTAVHDEINDARRFLWNLSDKSVSNASKRRNLQRALKEYDNLRKGWQSVVDENDKESKMHENKMSNWYKGRKDRTQISLADPDTYLFKMPGILGSSASSFMKQVPAMAASIVAGIASGGLSTLALIGVLGAGAATAFAFNRGAGVSENNAEVAQAAIERIKERTGLSEKDIDKIISGDFTDQKKLRQVTENIKDVENLFNQDMAATTWDAALDAALAVVPIGAMSKLKKFTKATKAFDKFSKTKVGSKILESNLLKNAASDFAAGSEVGALTGVEGGAITGAVSAVGGAALRNAKDYIVRKSEGTKLGNLFSALTRKMEQASKRTVAIDPTEEAARNALQHGSNMKYIKGITGRAVKSAVSEGIEEGKQAENAEAFKRGESDGKIKNAFQIALDDTVNGLTTGYQMLGMPLNALGIIDITDKDLLQKFQEMQGGMIGGATHMAAMNTVSSVFPYIRERKANEIVAEQVYSDKLAFWSDYKQYADLLKRGFTKPGYLNVLQSYEALRKLNGRYKDEYGDDAFSPELIDQAEEKYKRLQASAASPITKMMAKSVGIDVPSKLSLFKNHDEYRKFAALKFIADEKLDELGKNVTSAEQVSQTEKNNAKDILVEHAREIADLKEQFENSEEATPEEYDIRVAHASREASMELNEYNHTVNTAKLVALLKIRNELEAGLEANTDNKVKRGLKEELDVINDQIGELQDAVTDVIESAYVEAGDNLAINPTKGSKIITLEDAEDAVIHPDLHEKLVWAFEDEIKAKLELDSASRTYEDLFGKMLREDPETGELKDITGKETTEDGKPWNPYQYTKEIKFTGGTAAEKIKELDQIADDDDEFASMIEDVYKGDLKALHVKDASGFNTGTVGEPSRYDLVYDTNGNPVRVTFDENGIPDRDLADNEVYDENGFVYTDHAANIKNPIAESARVIEGRNSLDDSEENGLVEWFFNTTGIHLPSTPESFLAHQEAAKSPIGAIVLNRKKPLELNFTEKKKARNKSEIYVKENDEKTPQQTTINFLNKRYEQDKKDVLKQDKKDVLKGKDGYNTTSLDYFVMVDGKPVRMSRVHSVMPEGWERPEALEKANDINDKLKNCKTLDEVEQVVEKIFKDENLSKEQQKSVLPYIKYLTDYEDRFFNRKNQEDSKEFYLTLQHLSQSIVNSMLFVGPSVKMGNAIDELSRNFFGTPVLYANTNTEDGIKQLFDTKIEALGITYNELFGGNFKSFKNLIDQMRKVYDYYTNTLKWQLVTLPITWRQNFEGTGWVAGETDMIGVDERGDIHIIDFKTSKNSFYTTTAADLTLQNKYKDDLLQLKETDFKNGRPNKKVRELIKKIRVETGQRIKISWSGNQAVVENKLNNFIEGSSAEFGKGLNHAKQVLPTYEVYSNQQTTYAEMISLETGNTVKSIEILPFVCSYHYDANGNVDLVYSVKVEPNIPLMLSSKMKDILTNIPDQNKEVIDELRKKIDTAHEIMMNNRSKIVNNSNDELLNSLSDKGRLIIADYLAEIDNVIIPDNDDINALQQVLDEINSINDRYLDTSKSVKADMNAEARRRSEAEALRRRNERNEKRIQEDPDEVEVEAKNKSRSMGNATRTNLYYVDVKNNRELSLATISPDFITNSTFYLYIDGQDVYCDIIYHGKTFEHIKIDTKFNANPNVNHIKVGKDGRFIFDHTWTTAGKALYKKIHDLQKRANGRRIVAVNSTMTRTAGKIIYTENDKHIHTYHPVITTDIIAGIDLIDIEYTRECGYGHANDKGEIKTANTTVPIYTFKKDPPASGTLMFVKRIGRNELSNNRKALIPIALDRVMLSADDVDFITNLLLDSDKLDRDYFALVDGELKNTNATGRQFANLLIPIVDHPSQLDTATVILRNPQNPNIVYITNKSKFDLGSQSNRPFDLNNDKDLSDFKEIISMMSVTDRGDIMNTRLGQDASNELPFAGVRRFFKNNNGNGKTQTSLKITSTLNFDLDDFKTKTSKSGVKRSGLSLLGYYLKHNILITDYKRLGHANVEINDVKIEDEKSGTSVNDNGVNEIPTQQVVSDDSEVEVDISMLLKNTNGAESKNSKPLSEKVARRHLQLILGDNAPVEFQDGFIKIASGPAHIVGNATADCITISRQATSGVEYHEAFHRIFELLVDEKKRDSIYDKIAKRLDLSLYDENSNENKASFRICAEYIADKYMDHMDVWYSKYVENIPFLEKIFNKISDFCSLVLHLGDYQMYKLFLDVNSGKYKNITPSKKSIERFNRLYSNLHATIRGVQVDHIANEKMYNDVRETAYYCIISGQNVDRTGANIQTIGRNINKDTLKAGIDKLLKSGYDIIGQNTENPTVAQLAMNEYYEKFDKTSVFADDIAAMLSEVSTDYVKQMEEEMLDAADGDEKAIADSSIGEHTRASYEFARFNKSTSRVKFLFATFPDTYFNGTKEVIENGKKVTKPRTFFNVNDLGFPRFLPMKDVFNEFLNKFHYIDTADELFLALEILSTQSPLYQTLYVQLKKKIYDEIYKVEDGKIKVNADKEALFSQVMAVLRSNKHEFYVSQSKESKSNVGNYQINIIESGTDYNAKFYTIEWNSMLVNGGTPFIKINEKGNLVFNKDIRGSENAFKRIAQLFSMSATIDENNRIIVGAKEWINSYKIKGECDGFLKLKVNGEYRYYDNPSDAGQLEVVKDKMVEALNSIGININIKEFNYMLENKFGSSDASALSEMLNSDRLEDSMTSFLNLLNNIYTVNGVAKTVVLNNKKVDLKDTYKNVAFLKNLATWKYNYRHSTDQLTVIATGNNKFYQISDNNYISDVTRLLNKRGQLYREYTSGEDPYIYFVGEKDIFGKTPKFGSIVLKQMSENKNIMLESCDYIGMKTDKHGDTGQDYFKISKREDYVSKATILEEGGIILPTLSDKKTWLFFHGVKLPGLDYSNIYDGNGNIVQLKNLSELFIIPGDGISSIEDMISQKQDVVDAFISYAYSEYASVKKAIADIKQMKEDGTLDDEVINYYKEEQGARFASLIGVWDYEYKASEDGKLEIKELVFHSFNNKNENKTPEDCLKDAEKYFFNRTKEEQEALILIILNKIFMEEIKTCLKLGLIERCGVSDDILLDLKNIGLSNSAIQAIYKSIVAKNGNAKDQITDDKYKSYAIALYINDISNKALMSIEESERLFAGNPAFYEWKYKDGILIDRANNEFKRLGGMSSTGDNNFMDLQAVPEQYLDSNGKFTGKYRCAQCVNEEIGSPQISLIKENMIYGELLTAAKIKQQSSQPSSPLIAKINTVDSMSIPELKEYLGNDLTETAMKNAKLAYDMYTKKIDVADGAAYITDTMAEMLLRMNGNYSKDIQEAFKILREEKTSTILQKQLAYLKVITSVIGSQKYTAFGRRKHPRTGIQVNYYNKMALFPIFRCIATGKMLNLYDKMLEQKIDMLMVDSAVKLGGQGSKEIKWDKYADSKDSKKPTFKEAFKFNTYEQDFSLLRKQLNTDPKEESMMSVKTQPQKICLTNLFLDRTYYCRNGESISGEQLRDRIMNSMNRLSDRGMERIRRRFFKEDGTLDYIKFSQEMTRLLSAKDPDANILKALEIKKVKTEDGKTVSNLTMPLNAVSNASWLESILISEVNRNVIDFQTPGGAFIQRSVWAMEGSPLYTKDNILTDENVSPTIYNGDRLEMINSEGSMDCVVSVDFIKKMFGGDLPKAPVKDKDHNVIWDLIPEKDKNGKAKKDENGKVIYQKKLDKDGNVMLDSNGNPIYKRKMRMREMTFDELRNWLINRGIIGKEANASILGYRIPTQAQSSIHALRIVDIIPVLNDTVILPAEFTRITGSDFDIDKLYLSAIQHKISREVDGSGNYHQIVSTQFKESEDAFYANRLIEDYITLLLDWKSAEDHTPRTMNFLHKSIDNDTELLKKIDADLKTNVVQEQETPFGFYSLSRQTSAKNNYITGKIGIGPFALNNTNHILTMLYGVKFKTVKNSVLHKLECEDLSARIDKDGNSILSWLSGLINAHVDMAKDPYITNLNVNPFTYNIVNLLIRTGLGERTFYFTSQPIMKALAEAYVNASSVYMQDQSKTKRELLEEAIDNTIKTIFKDLDFSIDGLDVDGMIRVMKEGGEKNAKYVDAITTEIANLFNDSIKSDAKNDIINSKKQFLYYLAYIQFNRYGIALSNLVKYSKIDTKGHGKTLTEQTVYKIGYNKTFDTTRDDNLFEEEGLKAMNEKSYIEHKTKNALDITEQILSQQFIQNTPKFYGYLMGVINAIGKNDSIYESLVKKILNAMLTSIKSDFFVKEYVPSITNNPNYFHDLVSGDNTIYDRLLKLLMEIHTNPAYSDLISHSGEYTNKLLEMLVPTDPYNYKTSFTQGEKPDTYENMKFVKLFNFVEDGGSTNNAIIEAWDRLLKYKNDNKEAQDKIRKFARDLVVYAFITSGEETGFTKMFKYVPASWRIESGYSNFINDQLISYNNYTPSDISLDDLLQNNWFENSIVKTYDMKKDGVTLFLTYTTKQDGVPLGFPTMLAALSRTQYGYTATIDPQNAPYYIKLKRKGADKNSQRRFNLYKLTKIAKTNEGIEYPVYIKLNPKGNKTSSGFLITEYGRSDSISEQEYSINEEVLEQTYTSENVLEHVKQFKYSASTYASIIAGLNRAFNEETKSEKSRFSDKYMKHCKG